MKRNMGSYDKSVRLGIAIVLIVLYYKQVLNGTLGIIALVIALLLTFTSLIGVCPFYTLLGFKTSKK